MDPKRRELLVAAYVEGTLDEAAAAELLRLVEEDVDLRRELVEHLRTDRLLRAARPVDAEPVLRAIASRRHDFSTRVLARISRRPAPPSRPWPLLIALAAAGLLCVVALLASRRPQPPVVAKPPAPPAPVETRPEPEPGPAPAPKAPEPRPEPAPLPAPTPAPAPKPVPPPPPPVPAPEPAPAPLVEPPPKPTVVQKAVAALEGGRDLRAGESVSGAAALRFLDGSRVELAEGAELAELRENGGRLTRGSLQAHVAKRTERAFTIATPHAEAVVLGTRFSLRIDGAATILEVREGKVRLKRADGATVDVGPGFTATAARGTSFAARPILRTLAFQDGVSPEPSYAGTRDATISQLAPGENRSADAQLHLYRGAEGMETSVVRWDVSSIPAGSRIVAAEASFFVTGAQPGPGWRVHELRRVWEERDVTWRSPWQIAGAQGDADRGRFLAPFAPSAPGTVSIPLPEALVQQWIAGANGGLIFVPAGNLPRWGLESRESARPERRPRLSVTFQPPIR